MTRWSEVALGAQTHRFQTTRWSMVAQASRVDSESRAALDALCRQYWPPIYAFARRRSHGPEEALDLVQGFFAELLARESVGRADATRGRFRTFLLKCFSDFLANEHARATAQKRGGGQLLISLDAAAAEARFGLDPADPESPDRIFERRWALAVIDGVLSRLAEEYRARGRHEVFMALRPFLEGATPGVTYGDVAARIGLSEGAVKVTAHRMRQRFRELLVEEVGQTLADGEDAKEEVAALLLALGE